MKTQEILASAFDLLKAIHAAHDEAQKAKNPAIATLTSARSAIRNAVVCLQRHVSETPTPQPPTPKIE
jgi:hypothetical protein